jgi:probable biosynthetic protein (TIGR04099 family)
MNSLLRPVEVERLLSRGFPCVASPDAITLGMPHLCMNGLSETWLLKECGHRHWSMLAAAAGLAAPDFRDPAGNPIYAAFLSVSIRNAVFERAREHARLTFISRLARISRTRFMSFHRMTVAGASIGEIAMTSTFVRRDQAGGNHNIARIEVPELQQIAVERQAAAHAAEMTALRSDRWHSHLGFERRCASVIDRFVIDPCPGQDFNGADFLYFASYQAFVERAEWAFFRPPAPFPTTRARDIVYLANIDPGERLVVTLLQFARDPEYLRHWYRLERERDGTRVADAFSIREPPTRSRSDASGRCERESRRSKRR